MIQMIRVDYRLLHGQVAVSWTSSLGADCILLVSDTVLNDKLPKVMRGFVFSVKTPG